MASRFSPILCSVRVQSELSRPRAAACHRLRWKRFQGHATQGHATDSRCSSNLPASLGCTRLTVVLFHRTSCLSEEARAWPSQRLTGPRPLKPRTFHHQARHLRVFNHFTDSVEMVTLGSGGFLLAGRGRKRPFEEPSWAMPCGGFRK